MKTEIENDIHDTAGFTTTPEFNRLTKISFMYEWKRKKNRASKSQAENALDTADSKNTEKLKKHQTSDLRYLNGRRYFDNDGSQNNLIF